MKNPSEVPLNQEEWGVWTNLTKRIRFINGKIPKEAFYAWCENFYVVSIEFMGFRIVNENPEILLIYRNDEYYDGYHVPGAVLTPGQKTETAFPALIKRELGDKVKIEFPKFIKHVETFKGNRVGQDPRGQQIKMIFAGIIKGTPKEGEWFTKEKLPANIITEFQILVPDMLDWAKNNFTGNMVV